MYRNIRIKNQLYRRRLPYKICQIDNKVYAYVLLDFESDGFEVRGRKIELKFSAKKNSKDY